MTPFDSYFASKIEPALKGAPVEAVKLARQSAADIWNAAVDATVDPSVNIKDLYARVTP